MGATAQDVLNLLEEMEVDDVIDIEADDFDGMDEEDIVAEVDGDALEVEEKMAKKKTVGGKIVVLSGLEMKRKVVKAKLVKMKKPGQKIVCKKGTAQCKLVAMTGAQRAQAKKAGKALHRGSAVAKAARSRRKTLA